MKVEKNILQYFSKTISPHVGKYPCFCERFHKHIFHGHNTQTRNNYYVDLARANVIRMRGHVE